jgi:hypothetical protein
MTFTETGVTISISEKQAVKTILVDNMNQKSYRMKNLIANIISTIIIYDFPDVYDNFLEKICEGLADDEISQIDCSLRILILAFKPDEKYHVIIDKILENLFSAFTNSEADGKIREK